jgi:predicted Zn-dependent protease
LRQVEEEDVEYEVVKDEIAQAMANAKEVASTGTVLARLEALDHLQEGRLSEAADAAMVSLSWQRDHDEQSDAWVTLARVYHAQGRIEAASEAAAEANRLWPDNPRLRLLGPEVIQL